MIIPVFIMSYSVSLTPAGAALSSPLSCIAYDPDEKIIRVSCESASISEIDKSIQNPSVLHKESSTYFLEKLSDSASKHNSADKIWILNAGIVIEKDATLYIDSRDTSWLKIIPEETTEVANGIQVHGSLKIDSVKISSWNPETNDYVQFDILHKPRDDNDVKTEYDTIARPYIRVEDDATGTTDITNSELAYLGYEEEEDGHGRSGLLYYGGDGSVVKGNNIHHLRFGFYSSGVGGIVLEDNHVHHNYMYGFDPHTGTHDMIIRNNTVHDSGAMGIICSLDCYNVLIEDNEVYNSFGSGIMFSRNMTNSIARNNYVHHETQCIFVSQSHNNKVYNNKVSDCDNGLYLRQGSSNNDVYNNAVFDSNKGVLVNTEASDNAIHSNTINNATENGIVVEDADRISNMIEDNKEVSFKSVDKEKEQSNEE
jgi:mannuronan 5-epimerase